MIAVGRRPGSATRKPGRSFAPAVQLKLPASTSCIIARAVMDLVVEPMMKGVCGVTGCPDGSAMQSLQGGRFDRMYDAEGQPGTRAAAFPTAIGVDRGEVRGGMGAARSASERRERQCLAARAYSTGRRAQQYGMLWSSCSLLYDALIVTSRFALRQPQTVS